MKVTNTHYLSIDDLDKNLDIATLNTSKTLIQIFSGFVKESEVKQIQSIIKKKNSNVIFIGTTTAGEIYEGDVYEQSIGVSIMEFDDTTIEQAYFIDKDDFVIGEKIVKTLFSHNTKAAILFIGSLFTNGNDILDGINASNSDVVIAGGMAGDNGYFKETFVFDRSGVYSKGCVAVSLNSDVLNVFTDYQLNWQAIGKTMTVTKVEKDRVYEIDDISVTEIYKKYLGEKVGDNLPFSATEFPLLKIDDDGLEVCRAFTHQFEDGSLLTAGNLEIGDTVRLSFGNVDLILNDTKENLNRYSSFQPEALCIYSCAVRKVFLQSEITAELEPLNKIAPNIGFFTYGEIYHHDQKNSLLNISLTILALSEEKNKKRYVNKDNLSDEASEKNFITNKHYLVLDALTNLSNTVISELEDAKKQLKEQANRDYLTGLYNRRYFNEIAQDLIHISKREKKPFSVIMLDVDRFKRINDTYGHSVGDDVIKILSNTIIETVRESDIVARYGGEEFSLLLPFTDKEGALKIAEKIRKNVENKKIIIYDGKIIQFTVSLGVDSIEHGDKNVEQALNRADNALYLAKESGRNKVVVN
jgi:diguanylate cyclase (GGDEF)-like protein